MTLVLIKILISLLVSYIFVYNIKSPLAVAPLQIIQWSGGIIAVLCVFSFIWIGA